MGCSEVAMDIDLPTEFGPTVETVEALIEYLVSPLLPLKHSDIAKETLSESQQKSVAKQVHAAVVLYNYYHLNHHRESEFLNFDQFCNLAIMFKPSILHHMKYMCQSDRPTITDPKNQLSVTEKSIMDACTISKTLLNDLANVSSMKKEWPITKVAVLLIDSKKENCFLQFNDGVWSVIEKEIYSKESGTGFESKIGKKRMRKSDEEGESGYQKLAFSAAKEVTGIESGKLKVLESHVVYSLSQAKTATRFYIVQSTKSISEDNLVPIQDVISSLQGPVVNKCSGSWEITPVVEYYYLLPYADIISQSFSRLSDNLQIKSKSLSGSFNSSNSSKEEPRDSKVAKNTYKSDNCGTTLEPVFKVADDVITSPLIEFSVDQKLKETENFEIFKVSDNLQIKSKSESKSYSKVAENNIQSNKCGTTLEILKKVEDDVINSPMSVSPVDQKVKETENSVANKITGANSDSAKPNNMNGSCRAESMNSSSGASNKSIDKLPVCLQKLNENTKLQTPLRVYHHEKRTATTNSNSNKGNLKGLKKISTIIERKDEQVVVAEKKSCMVSLHENRTLTMNHALEDFNFTMDAKKSELSQAALRALLNKRQKLSNQQHIIETEFTLCNKKIQAIIQGGIGDCLGLKLEAVIDCCNEICQQGNMPAQQHTNLLAGSSLPKSLSEAQLTLRKACQELDDICYLNNWTLPTYHTSNSDGGFVANVTVKGTNFECSGVSGIQPSIHGARNSAATHVITKLQQMASERNTAALL